MKVLTQDRNKILSITDSTNISMGIQSATSWNIFLNFNAFYNLGCYEGEESARQIITNIFDAIKNNEGTFEMPTE